MEVLKDLIIWRLSVIFYRIYEITLSQEISNDIFKLSYVSPFIIYKMGFVFYFSDP